VQIRLEKMASIIEVEARKGHYSTAPQTLAPAPAAAMQDAAAEPAAPLTPAPAPAPGRMSLETVRNLLIEEGMMSPPSNVRRLRSDG
jgi:hypothetical protein